MAKQQQAISNWQMPQFFTNDEKEIYHKRISDGRVVTLYFFNNSIEIYSDNPFHCWVDKESFKQNYTECTREEFLTAYEKVTNNINQLIQE